MHTYNSDVFVRPPNIENQTWSKVCTTKVQDVAWTNANMTNNVDGSISYRVKNGICYVRVDGIRSSTMSTSGTAIANGLPTPEQGVMGSWFSLSANVGAVASEIQCLLVNVNNSGVISNYVGNNNIPYYGAFSYPVAE